MSLNISFDQTTSHKESVLIKLVSGGKILGGPTILDDGPLHRDENFAKGDRKTLVTHTAASKVVFLNVGPLEDLTKKSVRALAEPLYATLKAEGARHSVLDAQALQDPALAAHLADALLEKSYEFRMYKTEPATGPKPEAVAVRARKDAAEIFAGLKSTTESVFWASDRVNEAPNDLTPFAYAQKVWDILPDDVTVTRLGRDVIRDRGMGALHAVGKGSVNEEQLVIAHYDGSEGRQKRPLVLVGKGITFDTGGISIKPSSGMGEMKMDMGGSAAVAGAFLAAVRRKTTANVAIVLPLAENMPGGRATVPGSIVKSYSGKTVEIIDTDAEGRLVLADGIAYAQKDLNARKIVTAATLTGACMVALGHNIAGFFCNDNKTLDVFNAASEKTGEQIWRLPMNKDFEKIMTKGTPADIKNLGERWGGASTAASFLNFFVKDVPYGHLDMAGPGMPSTDLKGWGARLLNDVIRRHEPKRGR